MNKILILYFIKYKSFYIKQQNELINGLFSLYQNYKINKYVKIIIYIIILVLWFKQINTRFYF